MVLDTQNTVWGVLNTPFFFSFPTARARPTRADLSVVQHFAQKSAQNFVDYYLLTIPDKCGIISMSRGSKTNRSMEWVQVNRNFAVVKVHYGNSKAEQKLIAYTD